MQHDDVLGSDTPSPEPRAPSLRANGYYVWKRIIGQHRRHSLAVLHVLINIIPFIASSLQCILSFNGICNESPLLFESTGLLILTLSLFIIASFWIYQTNANLVDTKSASFIAATSIIVLLYLTQYALVVHIFQSHALLCDSDQAITHLVYYLFLVWIVMYSVLFITVIAWISCRINAVSERYGAELCVMIGAVFCQCGAIMIPSVLQIVLIEVADCANVDSLSVLETLLLPMMTFLACIFGVVVISTKDQVLYCLVLMFTLFTYGFIVHSCIIWNDERVDCGDFNPMKQATFVFFVIVAVEYSILILLTACFAFVYRMCA